MIYKIGALCLLSVYTVLFQYLVLSLFFFQISHCPLTITPEGGAADFSYSILQDLCQTTVTTLSLHLGCLWYFNQGCTSDTSLLFISMPSLCVITVYCNFSFDSSSKKYPVHVDHLTHTLQKVLLLNTSTIKCDSELQCVICWCVTSYCIS